MKTYLNNRDQDDQVIVLEINRMVRTNNICNCFDDSVSVEFLVAAH